MFKVNHSIITIIAICFSLTTGLLIGITLGEDLLIKQQKNMISGLETQVSELINEKENLVNKKQQLREKIGNNEAIQTISVDCIQDILQIDDKLIIVDEKTRQDILTQVEEGKDIDYTVMTEQMWLQLNDTKPKNKSTNFFHDMKIIFFVPNLENNSELLE